MRLKFLKILSSIVTILMLITQNAWTTYAAASDTVNIPDKNLENIIRDEIGKPTGDITEADMETIHNLNLLGSNINNLEGIQYAKHLRQLLADNCGISDISYLNGLTELMQVGLSNNKISDISALSGAVNLSTLDLNNNEVTNISALSNKLQLTNLTLDNNKITDISPLATDVNVAALTLNHNSISDISVLSGLANLESLRLTNNSISDISSVTTLNNLEDLYLSNNNITDSSPISGLVKLKRLYLSDNTINNIIPISGLNNLEYLYLANNTISDVAPLASLNKLIEINIANNNITDISALSGIVKPNLTFVNLNGLTLSNIMALSGISSSAQVLFNGYWKVRYIDENNNLIEPETIKYQSIANMYTGLMSRTFNSKEQITEPAKDFEGYELNDANSKDIILDNSKLSGTIEFHYIKSIGNITVKYQDENNIDIDTPKVLNNLALGTYTENYKEILGYELDDDSSKSVTLINADKNQTIIFKYKAIKGTLNIKYQDYNTGIDLSPVVVKDNLSLGTYTENAITLPGYTLNDESIKTISLTATNPNQTIIFKYNQNLVVSPIVPPVEPPVEPPIEVVKGGYKVKYIDESGKLLESVKSYENLNLGKYTEQAKNFMGYKLNDNNIKSITLTEDNNEQIIEFKYKEIKGSYKIRYIDQEENLLEPEISYSDLNLGEYKETAKSFKGYNLNDSSSKAVTLTENNREQVIEFKYKKIKGSYKVRYIDLEGNLLEPEISHSDLDLETYTEKAKNFKGYNLNDDSVKSVSLLEGNKDQVIEFKYKIITGTVQGTVTDDRGNPIEGVKVELHSTPQVTLTDKNGFYKFNDVELGEHTVKIIDANYQAIKEIKITLSVDENNKVITKSVNNLSEASQGLSLNQENNKKIVDFVVVPITSLPQTGDTSSSDSTPILITLVLGALFIIAKKK